MLTHTVFLATHGIPHERAPKRKLLPVDQLAMLHGIVLPSEEQLPASYSMRRWLTRCIATLNGHHKHIYNKIKSDPHGLVKYRAAARERARAWRAKHSAVAATLG